MSNILTTEDIKKLDRGTKLELPAGALLTSAARDLAEARGIELLEGAGATASPLSGGGPPPPPLDRAAREIHASEPVPLPKGSGRRGPTPELWSNLVQKEAGPRPAAEGGMEWLGPRATHVDGCLMGTGPCDRESMVVVTAVGRNRPRVLAELATGIADLEGDIQEISQRIVGGHFHAIITVDTARCNADFSGVKRALEGLSKEGDYQVHVQHEKVFSYMHRI
ncbi:MAG: ACT domain-containing protein [Planctomycetota bacterium]